MTEQIKAALDIYVAQTGIINILWNIFLAASVAILGYVYKDRTLMDDWKIKLGLTIGIPVVCVCELHGNFAGTKNSFRGYYIS